MPDTLEQAIEKLRSLPAGRRRAAAAVIEDFIANDEGPVYVLSDDERALVEEGLAEFDRGEYATTAEHDARIADILKR